jgi:DNA-binding Lrp family transcriptional regulator
LPKQRSIDLSVFKGREAKLNRAIFQTIALHGPQTIYDIHKEVKAQSRYRNVRYASVNKRVRDLEKIGCIKKVGAKRTKAGFEAALYELTTKAHLTIFLDSINLEDLLAQINETAAATILGIIIGAREFDSE